MRFEYGGILGVLVLAADIWAILNVFQSAVSNAAKVVWTLVILVLPVLGLVLWFFLGPRGSSS